MYHSFEMGYGKKLLSIVFLKIELLEEIRAKSKNNATQKRFRNLPLFFPMKIPRLFFIVSVAWTYVLYMKAFLRALYRVHEYFMQTQEPMQPIY